MASTSPKSRSSWHHVHVHVPPLTSITPNTRINLVGVGKDLNAEVNEEVDDYLDVLGDFGDEVTDRHPWSVARPNLQVVGVRIYLLKRIESGIVGYNNMKYGHNHNHNQSLHSSFDIELGMCMFMGNGICWMPM